MDFAVTAGLRAATLVSAAECPSSVLSKYEDFKKEYKNTAQLCAETGFDFTPVVFEAHGGSWSLSARQLFDNVAKAQRSLYKDAGECLSLRMAQRMSVTLHRESARAILRRSHEPVPACAASEWTAYFEEGEGP